VQVNGKAWEKFSPKEVTLPYDQMPAEAKVVIALGGAAIVDAPPMPVARKSSAGAPAEFAAQTGKLQAFLKVLGTAGLGQGYEAAHARLALRSYEVIGERKQMMAGGKIDDVPPASRAAAEQSFVDAAKKLYEGLEQHIARQKSFEMRRYWQEAK
jgi:hypothetical protein